MRITANNMAAERHRVRGYTLSMRIDIRAFKMRAHTYVLLRARIFDFFFFFFHFYFSHTDYSIVLYYLFFPLTINDKFLFQFYLLTCFFFFSIFHNISLSRNGSMNSQLMIYIYVYCICISKRNGIYLHLIYV